MAEGTRIFLCLLTDANLCSVFDSHRHRHRPLRLHRHRHRHRPLHLHLHRHLDLHRHPVTDREIVHGAVECGLQVPLVSLRDATPLLTMKGKKANKEEE